MCKSRASVKVQILTATAIMLAEWALPVFGGNYSGSCHGLAKGYLILDGGGGYGTHNPYSAYRRFIQLAGQTRARIVVIPTASITGPVSTRDFTRLCGAPKTLGAATCTVLHTNDRQVADSETFSAPLRTATGVFLEGGSEWRLTHAYLQTQVVRELYALLERGGVIAGSSAGASALASFLVRGGAGGNTIVSSPGHETGFGFLCNIAIDQHVDTRHRQNNLAQVLDANPTLLGLGLDENTSAVIHGDELMVNYPGRIAIWNGQSRNRKPYHYYLYGGDSLNLATRVPRTTRLSPFKNQCVLVIATALDIPRHLANYRRAWLLLTAACLIGLAPAVTLLVLRSH